MLESYPSIAKDEFKQACIDFEERCHDKLSETNWLSVRWTGQELLIAQTRLASRQSDATNTNGAEKENEIEDIEIDGADEEEAVCEECIRVSRIEVFLTSASLNVHQTRRGFLSIFRLRSHQRTRCRFCGSPPTTWGPSTMFIACFWYRITRDLCVALASWEASAGLWQYSLSLKTSR